jgi:hypothetical protein
MRPLKSSVQQSRPFEDFASPQEAIEALLLWPEYLTQWEGQFSPVAVDA